MLLGIMRFLLMARNVSNLQTQEADTPLSPSSPDHLIYPERIDTIILDIGDVLFIWSALPTSLTSTVDPSLLKEMLHSSWWHEYEKGNISEERVYDSLSQNFLVPTEDIRSAFRLARMSLQSDPAMIEFIREIKARGFRIFLMSNISAPDYRYLRENVPMDWSLFDGIFTSVEAGSRKPDICFFRHVLSAIDTEPNRVLFIDDKFQNVFTAKTIGMYGIVHSSPQETIRQLSNLCLNPITRAQSWLQTNKGRTLSVTSTGHLLDENFSPLLIVEVTGDFSLAKSTNIIGPLNFFNGAALMTTENFPNDLDTTSIGLSLICCTTSDTAIAHRIMDEMLLYKNEDGIIQVYFDNKRPRIDPVVCTNVLTLFHRLGRAHQLKESFAWVRDTLRHRAYTDGTLYYATPEAFLFFLGRLISFSSEVRQEIGVLFETRLKERFNLPGDALALAMRLLAAAYVDPSLRLLRTSPACTDAYHLRQMQNTDGSWAGGWLYKYGSSNISIQNDVLTTAFALKAMRIWLEGI